MADVVQDPGGRVDASSTPDGSTPSGPFDVVQNPGNAPDTSTTSSPLDGAEIGRQRGSDFFRLEGGTLGNDAGYNGSHSRIMQAMGDDRDNGMAYVPPAATIQGILATDGDVDGYDDRTLMEAQRADYAARMGSLYADDFIHPHIEQALQGLAAEERQAQLLGLQLQFNGSGELAGKVEAIFQAEQDKIAAMSPEERAAYSTDQEALRQQVAAEIAAVIDDPEMRQFLTDRFPVSDPPVAPDDPNFDPAVERKRVIDEISQKIVETGFVTEAGNSVLRDNAADVASAQLEGVVQRAQELRGLITEAKEATRAMSAEDRQAYYDEHVLPALEARFKGLTMAEAYQLRHTYNHITHAQPLDLLGAPTQQYGIGSEGDLENDLLQLVSPEGLYRTTKQRDQQDYTRLLLDGFNAETYATYLDARLRGVTRGDNAGGLEGVSKTVLETVGLHAIDRQDSIVQALDGLSKEQLLAVELAYNKTYIPESTNFTFWIGDRSYSTLRDCLNGELDDAHRQELAHIYDTAPSAHTHLLPGPLLDLAAPIEDPFTHMARVQQLNHNVDRVKEILSTEDMSYDEIAAAEKVDELSAYEPERREKAKAIVEILSGLSQSESEFVIEELGGRDTLLRVANRMVGPKYSGDILLATAGVRDPEAYLSSLHDALSPSTGESPAEREARAKDLHRLLFEETNAELWEDIDGDGQHDPEEGPRFREILQDMLRNKYGNDVDIVAAYQAAGPHDRNGARTSGNYFIDYLAEHPDLDENDPHADAVELLSEVYGVEEGSGVLAHLDSIHETVTNKVKEAKEQIQAEFQERMDDATPDQQAALQEQLGAALKAFEPDGAEFSKLLTEAASAYTARGELPWTKEQIEAAYLAAQYPNKK